MEDKPRITLFFYTFLPQNPNIVSYKLSFEDNIRKIDSLEEIIDVPEDVFKYGKDKSKIAIDFFSSSNEIMKTTEFPIYYYSENNIYLGLGEDGNGYNLEFVFKNAKDLKIIKNEKEFNSFDTLGTKDRKKLTLINYSLQYININQKDINIREVIEKSGSVKSNFYQISINLEDTKNIIVQPIETLEMPDFHLIMKKSKFFDKFYNELLELMNDKYNYNNHYYMLVSEYSEKKVDIINYNLNRPPKYLDEYFEKNIIEIDKVYKYQIFQLFHQGKKKYAKNKENFQKVLEKTNELYKKISEDEKLKIYEKLALLIKTTFLYLRCKDINSFNKMNVRYFILSECEKNSILDKTKRMFEKFNSQITEESKIFPYLLNLDSGIGYCNGESVYTFDMSNLKMIQDHLNQLLPKFLILYNYDSDLSGETNKTITGIAVNEKWLFKKHSTRKIIYDKAIDKNDEYNTNDIVVNLFVLLLHEYMGHKKFAYNRNRCSSPKKIINELNKLIELKRICDFKEEDGNYYILHRKCINKSDSGCFIESSFGKYGNNLITNILMEVNGKKNLIERTDLFADKTCEILRKYIILKYAAQEKQINIEKNSSIEDEIQELEKVINYEDLISECIKQKENQLLGKKILKSNDQEDSINSSENKNKKKKYQEFDLTEKSISVSNLKEELTEENEDDDSEYSDEEKEFERLYQKIIKKYGFKENELLIYEISKKIKDDSISTKEKLELSYVLNFLDTVI